MISRRDSGVNKATHPPFLNIPHLDPGNRQSMSRVDIKRVETRSNIPFPPPMYLPPTHTFYTLHQIKLSIILAHIPKLLRPPPLQPPTALLNGFNRPLVLSKGVIQVRQAQNLHCCKRARD